MSKHEHKTCEHINLKHCPKCDVVYCEDCEKEWGQCRTIVWDGSSPELDSGTTWVRGMFNRAYYY